MEWKRGFTPKDDKSHKTVFSIEFEDADALLEYALQTQGVDKVAEYYWEGYSIKGVNASTRQVEAKKGDTLKAIQVKMKKDFPDNSTVIAGVEKKVGDELSKLTKAERDTVIAKMKELGLLPTK